MELPADSLSIGRGSVTKDPKDQNCHIVLDVPPKIYVEDETWLSTEPSNDTVSNIESNSITHFIEHKLLYGDNNDIGVVIEKVKKRKKSKKTLKRYYHFFFLYHIQMV